MGTWYDVENFSKCFSDHTEQLLPWPTLLKNEVVVSKIKI